MRSGWRFGLLPEGRAERVSARAERRMGIVEAWPDGPATSGFGTTARGGSTRRLRWAEGATPRGVVDRHGAGRIGCPEPMVVDQGHAEGVRDRLDIGGRAEILRQCDLPRAREGCGGVEQEAPRAPDNGGRGGTGAVVRADTARVAVSRLHGDDDLAK